MRRLHCIALVLAVVALAVPASAGASEQVIAPVKANGRTLVFRLHLAADIVVRNARVEGRDGSVSLPRGTLARALRRHLLRIRLSPAKRDRIGGDPKLVVELAPEQAPDAPSPPPTPDPAPPATPEVLPVGVSPAIPLDPSPIPDDCTRFASPTGSDSGDGSREAPFRSSQRLVDSLAPGDIGCLDEGTYHEHILAIRNGGTADARVTLRSTPGQRALITGQIWVAESADYVTVALVNHDATYEGSDPRPSPVVNGDRALFYGMNVWSENGVCFYLGDREWGVAYGTIIRHDRIHDCGEPGLNHRHGIYIAQAVGTVIEENAIFDNPDRGIQFYPNGDDTIVRHNVIVGNGEGVDFSGANGDASSGNVVEENVIAESRLWHDVEAWWPEGNPVGVGNVVRRNCVWGGRYGAIEDPPVGFTASENTEAPPQFVDRAGEDFRISSGTGCAALLAGVDPG